jgi:hypothetical protein
MYIHVSQSFNTRREMTAILTNPRLIIESVRGDGIEEGDWFKYNFTRSTFTFHVLYSIHISVHVQRAMDANIECSTTDTEV